MNRIRVSSSQVKSIGHDPGQGLMHVEFRDGSVYAYSNVSPVLFEQLLRAKSLGSLLHKTVKAHPLRHPAVRISA